MSGETVGQNLDGLSGNFVRVVGFFCNKTFEVYVTSKVFHLSLKRDVHNVLDRYCASLLSTLIYSFPFLEEHEHLHLKMKEFHKSCEAQRENIKNDNWILDTLSFIFHK